MKKLFLILSVLLLFGAVAGTVSMSGDFLKYFRAHNVGGGQELQVTVSGAENIVIEAYENKELKPLYAGDTVTLTAHDDEITFKTRGTRLVPVSYSGCEITEISWTELEISNVKKDAELELRVENNLLPLSTTSILFNNFSNGITASNYQLAGCAVVGLGLSEGTNNVLKQYTPANDKKDTYHYYLPSAADAKFRSSDKDGNPIFNFSSCFVRMKLMATTDAIYSNYSFDVFSAEGQPGVRLWRLNGNGEILTKDGEVIGRIASYNTSDIWTDVAVYIDIDTHTVDYFINGRHVASCELPETLKQIGKFSTWGPTISNGVTRSVYVDEFSVYRY